MPQRPSEPGPPPSRKRGFLDEPEPEWVQRLKENRKEQVKQWEEVLGTEGSEVADDPPPAEADPPRRKLRRTSQADRRATPSFYDQDEEST
ncbi:MAG: hypothetical protein WEA10_09135 [Actinomycetota bacterium]